MFLLCVVDALCDYGNRYCKFDAITQMADMYKLPYTGVIDRPDLQVTAALSLSIRHGHLPFKSPWLYGSTQGVTDLRLLRGNTHPVSRG